MVLFSSFSNASETQRKHIYIHLSHTLSLVISGTEREGPTPRRPVVGEPGNLFHEAVHPLRLCKRASLSVTFSQWQREFVARMVEIKISRGLLATLRGLLTPKMCHRDRVCVGGCGRGCGGQEEMVRWAEGLAEPSRSFFKDILTWMSCGSLCCTRSCCFLAWFESLGYLQDLF